MNQPFVHFDLRTVRHRLQPCVSLIVGAVRFAALAATVGIAGITYGGESSTATHADKRVSSFLRENCVDCHDGNEGEAGFDVNALLRTDLAESDDANSLASWVKVFDRVADGEMPPADEGDVDRDAKERFLGAANRMIDHVESQRHERLGRVRARRLSNDQLQWTLCDLLSIDVPLARLMPDELRTDGFRNIADAQSMSHYHLEDHLRVVDAALDYAWNRARPNQSGTVIDLPASRIADKRKGQRNREPEMRKDAAVVWSGGVSFYGRISSSQVRQDGWYRISLDASSIKMPSDQGLWCSIRSGECVSRAPLMSWVGSFEATEQPQTFTFTAWIEAGHMLEIRPADSTLKKARFNGGQVGFGEGESQNVPGVAMHSLKIERIYPGGDHVAVGDRLFGELNVRYDADRKRFVPRVTSISSLDSVPEDLKQQLSVFARRAFRRPVSPDVLQPYLEMIDRGLDDGNEPIDVLREAYRAVLCSPRFIYFTEAPGRLDDHALANRLSYMITGKAPDAELRASADEGQLADPETIIRHTRRLLHGDHLRHFVDDFCDQWLDLADIDFTEPDRRMFSEFDLIVQNAMLEETRRYVETLISENQPARSLVDSDFTWLNNRLARYYQIDADIEASQWKRVSIADHAYRGGLMTHGSVLKVTANGTNTSPVVRGVWICDRLLGVPIPDPPANVPAIEPDVRGAETVRQILEKHRSQTECASCHARIDPPGFALEHFDAAGRWRDHYLTRQGKSYKKGPKIDSAYQLSDGREFDSFVSFRKLAADDEQRIARNLAAKLLVYGTGHEITFADRKTLDEISAQAESDGYGLRSIIEAVVTSATFLHK